MKKFFAILALIAMSIMVVIGCGSGAEKKDGGKKFGTEIGYKINGDKIIFVFNPADYPAGFDETEMVTLAGEMNGWDAGAKDWQLVKKDDGMWYFETTKDKIPAGTKFKFVVNTVDWQQPTPEKMPKDHLTDDGYGGFNLLCLY
ncbi:MAG: hypothetical protein A2086_16745 [Spirochaetes bacterium GWD1_27_9]|nr:MAG: hypothetical protein A2Z98_00600 [Spirochaetes bacterium GWB1_27_13]OHD20936.1 MAG: hypothetical protein A2Y34_11935 [Spirochaetes bacterium GWC1_27_15]OHD31161.1 MAG: hypothetical protein A2086_16745 [Spirochaetes bacterium GWD1_27_9]